MAQLIMYWKNNHQPARELVLPQNVTVVRLPELEGGVDAWLDIVQYDLTGTRRDHAYYVSCMVEHPNYKESDCFFLLEDGKPVATITVICDDAKKEGYIHMVGSDPDYRGKGYGTLLNVIAERELKERGMETAYLTTDDWRIPAIKSYLRAGFYPDLDKESDYKERWVKIYEKIGR